MHDLESFVRLVLRMRNAQRSYFRTRSTGDLASSKAVEREVDRTVKEVLDYRPLFPAERSLPPESPEEPEERPHR